MPSRYKITWAILVVSLASHLTAYASPSSHDGLHRGRHGRQSISQLPTTPGRKKEGSPRPTLAGSDARSDVRGKEEGRKWLENEDQSVTQGKLSSGLPAVTTGMESVLQVGRSYGRDESSRPWTPAGWGGETEASPPWNQRRWKRGAADAARAPLPPTGAIREAAGEDPVKKLRSDGRRKSKTWPEGNRRRDPEELPSLSSSRREENSPTSWPREVITGATEDRSNRGVSGSALCHSEGCNIRGWWPKKGLKVPERSSLYHICSTCHWSRLVEMAGKAESNRINGAKGQAVPQADNVPLATNGRLRNIRYGTSTSEGGGIQPNSPDQQRQPLDSDVVAFPIVEKESQSWKLAYDWKRGRKQKQQAKAPPVNGQYKERWLRLLLMGKRELDIWPMSFVTSDGNIQSLDNVWKFEKETDFWDLFAFSYPDKKPFEPAVLFPHAKTKAPIQKRRPEFVSRFGRRSPSPNSIKPFQKRNVVIRLGKRSADHSKKFSQPLWKLKRYSWRFVSRFGKRCLSWGRDDFTSPFGKRNKRADTEKFTSRFGKRRFHGDEDGFTSRFGKRGKNGVPDLFSSRFGKRSYSCGEDEFTSRLGTLNNRAIKDKFTSRVGKRSNSWDTDDFTSRFGKRGNPGVDNLFASRFGKRSDSWNKDDFTSRFGKRSNGKNIDYFASPSRKRTGGENEDYFSTRFGKRHCDRYGLTLMQWVGKQNNVRKVPSMASHHNVPDENSRKPESQVNQVQTPHPTIARQAIRISRRSIGRKPARGRLILLGRGGDDNLPSHVPSRDDRKIVSPDCLDSEHSSSCDVPKHRERRSITPLNSENTLEGVQTPEGGKLMLPVRISPEAIHTGSKGSFVATTPDQAHGKRRAKRGLFGLKTKNRRPVIRLGKRRPVIRLGKRRPVIRLGKRRPVIRLGKRQRTISYQSYGKGNLGAEKRRLHSGVLQLGKRAQAREATRIPEANIAPHIHTPPFNVLNNSMYSQNQRLGREDWELKLPTDGVRSGQPINQIPSRYHAALASYKRAYSARRSMVPGNTNHIKLPTREGANPRNGRLPQGIKHRENQERIEGHWSPPGPKGAIRVRQYNGASSEAIPSSPALLSKTREAIEKRTNVKSGKSVDDDDMFLIRGFEESVKGQRLPETYSKATWDGGTAE